MAVKTKVKAKAKAKVKRKLIPVKTMPPIKLPKPIKRTTKPFRIHDTQVTQFASDAQAGICIMHYNGALKQYNVVESGYVDKKTGDLIVRFRFVPK